MRSVVVPSGATRIGNSAFDECFCLESVTMGGAVTEIGDYAFYKCGKLAAIDLSSVQDIGECAFTVCGALTEATLGEGLSCIGERAFERCRRLKRIVYRGTLETWQSVIAYDAWDVCTPRYKIYCADGVLDKDDERNI